MEGAVIDPLVGATIKVVLQTLHSICDEEIKLIRDLKKDLKELKDSFVKTRSFLYDAEKKQDNSCAVKRWLTKLEDLAFDVDDVLDELNYQVLCKKMETQNKIKFNKVFSSNRKMAHRIRDINNKLKSINQEAIGLGFQTIRYVDELVHGVGSDSFAYRGSGSYSIYSKVFGREDDVSIIVKRLLNSTSPTHEQVISVIPIVGMGGLGKTTLARLVFSHEEIKSHFQKLFWVCLSDNFDAKYLYEKILESLTGQKCRLETDEALLVKIQQNLEAKKYLLVLDDVRNEDMEKWNFFISSLSGISSGKGNCVIVTTRSQRVASIVCRESPDSIHELSLLTMETCWSIIRENAFLEGNIPSEYETIGKTIAERCRGLPLVARVLGSLLKGKSRDNWRSIAHTVLSELGKFGDPLMMLKLNFDNLPSPFLKKCFAYCSIFPSGYVIEREMLIKLWMAEGFLQSDEGIDMETVGGKYFDLLLQNSLLQVEWRDDRNDNIVTHCRMHDIIHGLARSIESGKFLDIHTKSNIFVLEGLVEGLAGFLRSLIIEGEVSENMFSRCKSLRSLVLNDFDVVELPNIRRLIHLRYLDISCPRITCLPRWIGNLYHLQTLRVNCGLNKLPTKLKNLINLRHLHIQGPGGIQEGIRNEEILMIGHLPHLKSLCLKDLPYVRSLGSSIDGIHDINGVGKDMIIVFPALERLELSSMPNLVELLTVGKTQPGCEVVAFPRLESMLLSYCHEFKSPAPSDFSCLKELEISGMKNCLFLENLLVKFSLLTKLTIARVDGLVCLPDVLFLNNLNLSYLSISDCDDLTHLAPLMQGGGACLREFKIYNCQNLEELPDGLHYQNSLMKLDIHHCPKLKSIPSKPSGEDVPISMSDFNAQKEVESASCEEIQVLCKRTTSTAAEQRNFESSSSSKQSMSSPIRTDNLASIPEDTSESNMQITIPETGKVPKVVYIKQETLHSSSSQETKRCFNDSLPENENYLVKPNKPSGEDVPIPMSDFNAQQEVESASCEEIQVLCERTTSTAAEQRNFESSSSSKQSMSSPIRTDNLASIPEDTSESNMQITIPETGKVPKVVDIKQETLHSSSQETKRCFNDSLPENENYLVITKDNLVKLHLEDHQSVLLGDHLSSGPVERFGVINLVEKDLHELHDKRDFYPDPLLLFLQRNNRLTHIHSSFFNSMPGLCFLDLSDTKVKILPSSLFGLSKLKVLMLRNCVRLDKLPSEIGKLKQLELLDLSGTELYNIPDEIGQLTLLRHLQLLFYGPDDESEYAYLPSELISVNIISKLKALEALSIIVHPEDHRWIKVAACVAEDVGMLKMLSYLQIYFPEVENFERFIESSPSWNDKKLSKFKFVVGCSVKRIVSRVPDGDESKYDQQGQCLRFVNGETVPEKMKVVLLHVRAFYLDHHVQIRSLSEFGISNLKGLKFCMVTECPNVNVIIDEERSECVLPCLEHLGVYYLWELKQIWKTPPPVGSFHALKSLIVNTCPKLKFILLDSMLHCFPNLEEFVVEDCASVEKIVEEEKDMVINYDTGVVLPRLRNLVLKYLPRLVSLGNGLCISEEKISSYGCPNLELNSQPRQQTRRRERTFGWIYSWGWGLISYISVAKIKEEKR